MRTLLLRRRILQGVETLKQRACALCCKRFVKGQRVVQVELLQDVAILGVVYSKGTTIEFCHGHIISEEDHAP